MNAALATRDQAAVRHFLADDDLTGREQLKVLDLAEGLAQSYLLSAFAGPRSVVWEQAENRRHVQKSLLAFLDRHADAGDSQ